MKKKSRRTYPIVQYSTAATEVIIVIESEVYDAVGHGNEWWMDGWMEMNE